MVAKRGWIRIVEAFVAVMLILSVFVYIYYRTNQSSLSGRILNLEQRTLDEIAYNDSLRLAVINYENKTIYDFIKTRIGGNLDYNLTICRPEEVCGLASYPSGNKEVYARDTLIFTGGPTGNVEYAERKIKLFVWVK